jgi:hypothetical protein
VSHELSYDEAVALVAADVRKSYPELSYREAVNRVVDTVALRSVRGDDQLATAYRVVLARHTAPQFADLVELVKLLAGEGVVQLSIQQRIWVELIQCDVPLA